jgi:minor extracellular serine protease Vpr
MKIILVYSLIIAISVFSFSQIVKSGEDIHIYLERSVPFVGGNIPHQEGIEGNRIKIAIIDTGVDFNHPDLYGWGADGKVVGGYNFINPEEPPLDTNGHGTQVAGVVAANGKLIGVAPQAKILAYKVSENGEAVSSDLIIKAIDKAIEDKADIINISLGVNQTNEKIDQAVNKALDEEIFVVTAAGNDGPVLHTIGSPGRSYGSVTVGATYNNLTSSLVATLEVNEKPYTVIPMVGSSKLDEPIIGRIVFGGYGKTEELTKINVTNSILLVERGSDIKGELLYFSVKEKNAASAGAKALIIYNNEPGIFLGELIHEFVEPDYKPQIPVVSIDRDEGLEIKQSIKESKASLHLFYNPDFVAHFSSRGPVSPFYIKPDIMAPGAYINTTQINGGYNFTSGTSFAAPHVSGAAALLMEKDPNIHHHEIKSLLLTTAEKVSDAYGKEFSINDSGSGRVNINNALNANLIITPPNFVANASLEKPNIQKQLKLKLLKGSLESLKIEFIGPDFIQFAHIIEGDDLLIKMNVRGHNYGEHEGKIIIYHDEIKYTIPFLIHYTEGSISTKEHNGKLEFVIEHPENWNFAKVDIINSKEGTRKTVTTTPQRNATIDLYENSEYWIEAKIRTDKDTFEAFDTVEINSTNKNSKSINTISFPQKQLGMLIVIILAIGIIGMIVTIKKVN